MKSQDLLSEKLAKMENNEPKMDGRRRTSSCLTLLETEKKREIQASSSVTFEDDVVMFSVELGP